MLVPIFNGFSDTCRVLGSCERSHPPLYASTNATASVIWWDLKAIQSLAIPEHCRPGNQYGEIGIDAGLILRLFELEGGLSEVHRLLFLLDPLG
jgi:hypothetical protein